jgi:hypothetical protein
VTIVTSVEYWQHKKTRSLSIRRDAEQSHPVKGFRPDRS